MFQMGLSTFVSNLRLSKIKNEQSSLEMPIMIENETLYKAQSLASMPSPFVMNFVTWLTAMVGSVLLFLATNQMTLLNRAYVRTVIPIMTMGASSLVLAIVVTTSTLQWGSFIMLWLAPWLISVCLELAFPWNFYYYRTFRDGFNSSNCLLSISAEWNYDSFERSARVVRAHWDLDSF